jgi:hypothetical protein
VIVGKRVSEGAPVDKAAKRISEGIWCSLIVKIIVSGVKVSNGTLAVGTIEVFRQCHFSYDVHGQAS